MRDKRIVIKTNKYAGNFERALVGYCVGRLSDEQEEIEYDREYVRAFWQNYGHCDTYEEYLRKESNQKKFEDLMRKANIFGMAISIDTSFNMKNIYEDYLEFQREETDDVSENTFYSVDGKEISIWVKQDLPDKFLKLFVQRIRSFFENNVLEIFENAIYLTKFDSLCSLDNRAKLLDLYYEDNGVKKDV